MKKGLQFLCVVLLSMFMLTACGGDDKSAQQNTETQKKEETQETQETQDSDKVSEEYVYDEEANVNLLTGINDLTEEAIGKRPVAVMVNNVKAALPQYGIAEADIIFEMVVEANQTRFMAMYGDYTQVPKICSVRSARKYFPAMSEGFDAIYVNWGRNEVIIPYLESLELTQYEGLFNEGNLFGRDKNRQNSGYALEHTGYFDGTKLADVLVKDGERIDIEADKATTAFRFNKEQVKPSQTACTVVDINFGAARSTFKYDEASNTYLKEHFGQPQMDGVAGTQLAFTNVFVLEAKITEDTNGIHKDVDWHGGNGYYVSNGAVQKITWSKASEESRLMFFDEEGNELSINRGKSYIGINYIGQATFE